MGAEDREQGAGDLALAPTLDTATAPADVALDELTAEHPGRYRRAEELGHGAMGRVVLAFDSHLGREVAMKELLAQSSESLPAASAGVVTRFLREARVTGQLEHPAIVPVHELGVRPDGTLYYTMKRIRGRSLGSALRDAKTLQDRLRLISHFRRLCEAVAYAHSRGVVHRDLKPENVMVGEFGETLVVDWGLAKVRGSDDPQAQDLRERVHVLAAGKGSGSDATSTIHGHAIGTPAYMSPEQARGDLEAIDERSDVWGLGAILFEILTGRPPFVGGRAMEVLEQVREKPAPRVRDVSREAPAELAAIADRALVRDRSSRYPGAKELADEIAAWQDGGDVRAYEYSTWDLVRRFVGRHRVASLVLAGALAAGMAATIVTYRGYLAEGRARAIAESRRAEAASQRDALGGEVRAARAALARGLARRARAALDEGDPAAAAIYAAGALLRGPDDDAAREERAAAVSAYLDAEDARRFVLVRRIDGAGPSLCLSPDGRELAYATREGLVVEEAEGGRQRILRNVSPPPLAFAFEGHIVVGGSTPSVIALEDASIARELPAGVVAASANTNILVVARGSGELIAYGAGAFDELARAQTTLRAPEPRAGATEVFVMGRGATRVERWPLPFGGEPAVLELDARAQAISVSPAGILATAITAPALVLHDSSGPRVLAIDGAASDVAFLDDKLLVSAERDGERALARSVTTGAIVETFHVPAGTPHRVHAGGSIVVLTGTSPGAPALVYRRQRTRDRSVRTLDGWMRDLVLDRGRAIVVTSREVVSFAIARSGLTDRTRLATIPRDAGEPETLAVARDGALAVVTSLGAVLLYEPGANEPRRVREPGGTTSCPLGARFVGEALYFGTEEGPVLRYHRETESLGTPLEGHTGAVCSLARAPGGTEIASASLDGTLRLWDASTGRLRRTLGRAGTPLRDVAYAQDGEALVTGDALGGVSIVRRRDGSEERRARPHGAAITRVRFSRDGRVVMSSSLDRSVRLETRDGSRLVRTTQTHGATRALLSFDGQFLYYLDGPDLVRLAAEPSVRTDDPQIMLRSAEERAGAHLGDEGLEPR